MKDLFMMSIIMFLSGLLSTMNVWANKINDIRLSINDIYMSGLMIGWMILLMGLVHMTFSNIIIGCSIVILFIYAIRTQAFVNFKQYSLGMIPHHSMAIHMSKKMLEKEENIPLEYNTLLQHIIQGQEKEIELLKQY